MDKRDKKYWFIAKQNGRGWGLPCRWQGWAAVLIFMALLIAGSLRINSFASLGKWVGYVIVLSFVLLAVCWVKGEPPHRGV